ncbi:hypothetical protein ACVQ8P_02610 [Dellaglioa sp. BT-FLS60]
MAKKYLSDRTRTGHTYEFYKDRQNNPQWRDDFLRVRATRRRNIVIQLFVGIIIIGILAVLGLYFMAERNTAKNMTTQSTSILSSKASSENVDSTTNSSSADSSDEDNIPISDVNETSVYQATTEIGPYSVSTEDMNAVKMFSWNLGAVNRYEKFSLKLNNQTGVGTLFEYDDSIVKRGQIKVHYREIKTKKIVVAGRTVKVNTLLISKNASPRYVFENNSGGISIAQVVTDNSIPHPFYVEAK